MDIATQQHTDAIPKERLQHIKAKARAFRVFRGDRMPDFRRLLRPRPASVGAMR